MTTIYDIEQLAFRCGVTMGDACQAAGISPANPARWKRGTTEPRGSKLHQLAQAVITLAVQRGELPRECEDKSIKYCLDALQTK